MNFRIISVLIGAAVIAGSGYYWYVTNDLSREQQCTTEAKLCPDGSAVGRTGPNCEFAKCPGEGEEMMRDDAGKGMGEDTTGGMMNGDTAIQFSGTVLAGNVAKLIDFNQTDYEKALASGKLVVLYFYANWCPLCRAEFPKMQAAFNALSTDAVVGFRVNYNDNETDSDEKALARQFGVGYQHTKVFVKNGERILKAPDSWTEARYASEITKVLGE